MFMGRVGPGANFLCIIHCVWNPVNISSAKNQNSLLRAKGWDQPSRILHCFASKSDCNHAPLSGSNSSNSGSY